jgi:hypothetical protein
MSVDAQNSGVVYSGGEHEDHTTLSLGLDRDAAAFEDFVLVLVGA